ncbi:MAG: lysophospholipid acyltransferase family protein, partial [Solirubrobacteraceae bacterium]
MRTQTAQESSHNGRHRHGNPFAEAEVPAEDHTARGPSPIQRLAKTVAGLVGSRVPVADLDERDPDYIRESLPGQWLLASIWFRGEVRGLGNIPEDGPVLLVGNHSGGNMSPDSLVFTLAFSTYFGVERPFYQLAHNLVLSMPGLGFLRRYGTVAASPENARRALESGAALLVYPGGDVEVHRPTWEGNRVNFDGRRGFVRLALEHDVPIVPVVAIGWQETALFLSRGEGLAKLLMLDRL